MFEKGKREQGHGREDAAFNRMLLWLLGAVAAELLIMLIKRIYVNGLAGWTGFIILDYSFLVFSFLGPALAAACIVWAVLSYRRERSAAVPCICAAAAAGLWVLSGLGYFLYDDGMNIMMVLPAVGAVLIVVYFLYQRVFFLNTMITADGLIVLWMYQQYYPGHPKRIWVAFAAGFVLLAAALALSLLLRRGGGKFGRLRVMPADTSYLMTWITCALTALALIVTLALTFVGSLALGTFTLGTAPGLYLLFALVAWEFVQTVFYTVRLM